MEEIIIKIDTKIQEWAEKEHLDNKYFGGAILGASFVRMLLIKELEKERSIKRR